MSTELWLPLTVLLVLLVVSVSMIRATLSGIEKRLRTLWQIEAKLDLLLQHANIQFDPYRSLPAEIVEAMRKGERVRAIKLYRDASGAQLKEAVDFIDEALRRAAKA